MPTKKQIRAGKTLGKKSKQKKKFPELLLNIVESSDLILQILDSRFIDETRNKEIEELIKSKKKTILYCLNKSDLIDKKNISEEILAEVTPYVFISALNRIGGKELREKIKILSKEIEKTSSSKWNERDYFYVGVIGYPNVGKSSVINILIGSSGARVGASAGYTKGIQKLKLTKEIVLLDSPGVIPKEEYSNVNQDKISGHVLVGARDWDNVKDPEIAVSYIFEKYKESFLEFYKIDIKDSDELIEKYGRKKGILQKGGEVNTDQVARIIIRDWQKGKIRIM